MNPPRNQDEKSDSRLNLEQGQDQTEFGVTLTTLTNLFEKQNFESGRSTAQLDRIEKDRGLVKALHSHKTNGICADFTQITKRQQTFGTNSFPEGHLKSFIHFVWLASCDFCIRILSFCALLLFLVAIFTKSNSDALWQAISLLIAVLAVILIQAITDYRKERQFHELFSHQDQQQYKCVRHQRGNQKGDSVEVREADIVVGDIVEVQGGNYMEVDGILVTGSIEVDESSLTGKSITITQRPYGLTGISQEEQVGNPFLRSGSSVLNGTGFVLVLCVGQNSLIGQMKSDIAEHDESSLLANSLATLAKFLVKLGAIFAMIMFAILMFYSVMETHESGENMLSANGFRRVINDFIEAFLIIVLSVPEGLPLIMTLGLSFAVIKLQKEGVVVRNLNSVTQIGGTDIILFDKTGTLTTNQVRVSRVFSGLDTPIVNFTDKPATFNTILAPNVRNKVEFFIENFTSNAHLESSSQEVPDNQLSEETELRSMKSVDQKDEIKHHNIGNPLDYALEYFGKRLRDLRSSAQGTGEQETWSKTERSDSKSSFTCLLLRNKNEQKSFRILVKGSVSSLLDKCTSIESSSTSSSSSSSDSLTGEQRRRIQEEIVTNQFGKKSMRVMAIAYRDVNFDGEINDFKFQDHFSDLRLLVILGLFDEPRAEARKTIKETSLAGIQVMMTTGDSKGSALHIAFEVGLTHEESDEEQCVLAQSLLSQFNIPHDHQGVVAAVPEDQREAFYEQLKATQVVYEASSDEKLLIVNTFKSHEHTIGYVGDGNNDSKALSHADVGFSMGVIGTEVAKQSSNIILANDSLIQIVGFVEWGRNIYYNLERFIYFQITFFSAEVIIMIISSVILKESPYSVLEIIWLSLIHDIVSAIALSTEKPKKDGERGGKPFQKNQNILHPFLVKIMVIQGLYQTIVLLWMLFQVPEIFHILPSDQFGINHIGTKFNPEEAIHYTMVFHSTAMIQITNLINSRRVKAHEYNQFERISSNRPFIFFIAGSYLIQNFIIYFGGSIFQTAPLTFQQNLFCHLIGFGAMLSFWFSQVIFSPYEPNPNDQAVNSAIIVQENEEGQRLKDD